MNCKVIKSKMYLLKLHIIIATLLLIPIFQQVRCSGVFELEFLKLQPLETTKQSNTDISNNRTIEQEQVSPVSQTNELENPSNLIQVLVCLKEAFTSQLDGPCTFGNASITLHKDSILQEPNSKIAPSILRQRRHPDEQDFKSTVANKQQQGSLLTNVVRILFTFRWTKSFTIILTAEEIERTTVDNQKQHFNLPNRRSPNLATLIRPTTAINGTNLVDFSTNLRLTKDLTTTISPISATDSTTSRNHIIDRHVLTENEVLPNLEPNPNKPWANRFSRSLKSSIAYRFRVYCSLNYYGDGCTTFCRARDDQFGHYNCSSTGQKVCSDGWYGPDCDRAKCGAGCNQQHGYCEKPNTCQCRPGWTGTRCDECITYPGCMHGYCLSPWQCICKTNWGGVLCDLDLNVCLSRDPCKNNSTCINIAPGKYKCVCSGGFTGVDCGLTIPQPIDSGSLTQLSAGCALNPCLNGGTCYGFKPQSLDRGQLESPLEGPEVRTDNTNKSVELIYRCQCPSNWTGDYCQWADSPTLSVTNIMLNATIERGSTTEQTNYEISTKFPDTEIMNTMIGSFIGTPPQTAPYIDMKHIISWVVIASIVGVFLASLLLAWCCLIAIEHNRFSFIQMNVIRNDGLSDQPAVTSTLRRMHEKFRDSFRLSSRARIKPETKLSIENVLRPPKPPPPYEENDFALTVNKASLDNQESEHKRVNMKEEFNGSNSAEDTTLVIKGALEQKLASTSMPTAATCGQSISTHFINDPRLKCPKHGHLYRQQTPSGFDLDHDDQHSPQKAENSKYATRQAYSHFQTNYHLSLH